ncbi:MAG: patatin-like phospholipase family protein [Gammaproteobacteria bacterium]|nr:patatin-like phospholipase family protein [Gammaproteobacteria bacterium]
MPTACKFSLFAMVWTLLIPVVHAQSDTPDESGDRLRVGLVLGGGGARGAAHIGVLRELERRRVPIDAIAGTSMGAIVGGLYAIGMTADELEELVGRLDWTGTLSDPPRRRDLSFRRKQDDEQFPIQLELGVRDGELLLPKGVVQGQKLDLLLRELTSRVSHITNFDELPIPYRAVASDIERGEAYVMGSGDLARAIRASMSVPGLFAPATVDGRLLVDGGLVSNLPVDVARGMGVDVVIAVDVEFPFYAAEELDSAVTISEQMLTLLIRKETLRQIATLNDTDILIQPELGTFASSDFANIRETINPGADATIAADARLAPLSLSEEAYRNHLAAREFDRQESGRLGFVRIVHDGRLADELLIARLDVVEGDRIDAAELAAGANRLYALSLYEQVSYSLVEEGNNIGVEYRAIEKSWGPNFLQFGLSVEDDFDGSTAFNLSSRLTRAGLNRQGAEWRMDAQIGTTPLLFSEFYQPLGRDSRWFVAPHLTLTQRNQRAFSSDDSKARLRISEATAGLDVGRELGSFGELRFGAFRGTGETRVKVGNPGFDNFNFDTGGIFGQLRIDTLDDARFPRTGSRADIRWDRSRPALGADDSADHFVTDLTSVWSRGKSTLSFGLNYATTLNAEDSVEDFFPLGGFLRLSGLERGAISGPHAALARLVYYRRVGDTAGGLFDIPIYLGASLEAGNVWQNRSDIDISSTLVNGSLFAGFDTYFGAIYLAAGFAEGGGTNYYLFIGSPPR